MKKTAIKNPLKRKKTLKDAAPGRITNETVAEHREKILAGGRKFKYPHQYVKHRLVITAVIIAVCVILVALVAGWWQLYRAQATNDFMYRVTRVVPLPVASVDGEAVRYSDYLMRYRSHEHYLRQSGVIGLNSSDDKVQLDFFKRTIMDGLEQDVYAQKLAKEKGVSVTDDEVAAVVDAGRNTTTGKISQDIYDASAESTLGVTAVEYHRMIEQALLRHKVAYAIDDEATAAQKRLSTLAESLKSEDKLDALVATLAKDKVAVEYGASAEVSRNNRDGGLTQAALGLKVGEVSSVIKSTTGDGYYLIRRLAAAGDKVSYEFIHVPLTKFKSDFKAVKEADKIREYITVKADEREGK